jgi:hypothetical protein
MSLARRDTEILDNSKPNAGVLLGRLAEPSTPRPG